MKIPIDIGHARGTGASGNGIREHAIAEHIAWYISDLLREAGHQPVLIDFPDDTNALDLNKTVRAINAGGYPFSISLHCDCSDNKGARGAHVCFYSGRGKILAEKIARVLCPLLPGRAERIVRRTDLKVLKKTDPPAVLVECGFISNKEDAAMMQERPGAIAACIADGILAYIETLDN